MSCGSILLDPLAVSALESGGAGAADLWAASLVLIVGGDIADRGVQPDRVVLGADVGELGIERGRVDDAGEVRQSPSDG